MSGCPVMVFCSYIQIFQARYEERKAFLWTIRHCSSQRRRCGRRTSRTRFTGLWDVVNELTRFRRTTRQNYRVTIFGSARLKRATPIYNGVKKLAAELKDGLR